YRAVGIGAEGPRLGRGRPSVATHRPPRFPPSEQSMALRAFLVLSTVSLSVYLFASVPGARDASRAGDASWDAWAAEPGPGAVRFASAALEAAAPEPSAGGRAGPSERPSPAERT